MTTLNGDQLEQLDIQLGKLGGLDLTSTRQLLTTAGSVVTFVGSTNLGKQVGLNANQRLASLIVGGLLIAAYVVGKSIHHAAVEKGNAAVKVAAIAAASNASTPVVLDSPPDAQTVQADPSTEPALPQPPDVGADLPVETVSTTLPAAAPAA